MSTILPDCMMPDGAEPCEAYQKQVERANSWQAKANEALAEINRLRALRDRYEVALQDIVEWTSSQPPALNMPDERWQAMRARDMASHAYRALHLREDS